MFKGESLRIDPFAKRGIVTSAESARECFRYWDDKIEIYCVDFEKLKIARVTNLREAEEFFGKVFE